MPRLATGGRYPVLRSLAIVNLAAAAILVVLGIVTAGWAVWGYHDIWYLFGLPATSNGRILLALMILGGTFFIVCGMVAVTELVKLLMDVASSLRSIARTSSASSAASDGEDEAAEMALIRGH